MSYLNENEERAAAKDIWGQDVPTPFDRLFARNLYHVIRRQAGKVPTNMPLEPSMQVAIITCMDCQVDPHEIFRMQAGEAIVLRNGGNSSNPDLIRSLIVAVHRLGVSYILVLGHTNCSFKNLDAKKFDQFTKKHANVSAESFGFHDAKAFYRPFADAFSNAEQLAGVLQANPLFQQKVEVMAAVYDDRTGFVYEVAAIPQKTPSSTAAAGEPSPETSIVIKPNTPAPIQREIQKLIDQYLGYTPYVLKILHKWDWDKYILQNAAAGGAEGIEPAPSVTNIKLEESNKMAELAKLKKILSSRSQRGKTSSPPKVEISQADNAKGNLSQVPSGRGTNIPQLPGVRPLPKIAIPTIMIPKISVPRVPRLHLVIESTDEEKPVSK